MRTIWKFPLKLTDEQDVLIPSGPRFLTVQMQGSIPTLWASVDTEGIPTSYHILCRGTGHPLNGKEAIYLGTVQERQFVWHFFEGEVPDA